MDSFEKYMNMSIEELETAKREIYKAFTGEMIKGLGAQTVGESNLHAQNVTNLGIELKFVTELIKEAKNIHETLG